MTYYIILYPVRSSDKAKIFVSLTVCTEKELLYTDVMQEEFEPLWGEANYSKHPLGNFLRRIEPFDLNKNFVLQEITDKKIEEIENYNVEFQSQVINKLNEILDKVDGFEKRLVNLSMKVVKDIKL